MHEDTDTASGQSPTLAFDVVVIGGGIAGMSIANRAADKGARVVILEKGNDATYPCNTRFSSGTFHVCFHDIMTPADELLKMIEQKTSGATDAGLARTLAEGAADAVSWLRREGINFVKTTGSLHRNWVLAPPRRRQPGLDWQGRSGDVALRKLEANLTRRGGEVLRGTRAVSLVCEAGRCVGVLAESNGQRKEVRARAVAIADGGFQANPDLVTGFIAPAEALRLRGADTGCGDGLSMARDVGAAFSGMNRFYGHVLSRDAMQNDRLWPYPYMDTICDAAIMVDGNGERFTDEGRGGVAAANAISRLSDPLSACAIFDCTVWKTAGQEGLIPANPLIEREGATIHVAEDLTSLADKAGLPGDALERTVRSYNAFVAGESSDDIVPARTQGAHVPAPIRTGPFYAVPLCAGITYTMGGIVTDSDGHVLTGEGAVIPGLFAAGACTGGLEGGAEAGYVGGLSKSVVFGLRAADAACSELALTASGGA